MLLGSERLDSQMDLSQFLQVKRCRRAMNPQQWVRLFQQWERMHPEIKAPSFLAKR